MWKFDIKKYLGIAESYQKGWEKAVKAWEIEKAKR